MIETKTWFKPKKNVFNFFLSTLVDSEGWLNTYLYLFLICARLSKKAFFHKLYFIKIKAKLKSHACIVCDTNSGIVYWTCWILFRLERRYVTSCLLGCYIHLLWMAKCYHFNLFLYHIEIYIKSNMYHTDWTISNQTLGTIHSCLL